MLLSCQGIENECSNRYDNNVPASIDRELIFAKDQIIANIDSLRVWKEVNKKLIGQEAGILAHIDLRLWNLIDGAYLESITIKDEKLILFEYYTHSCDWEEEYILFNKSNRKMHDLFKDSKIKVDSIKPNWLLIKVKKKFK